jgi:hypothetical protein
MINGEMKKRAILDLLKAEYRRASRFHGGAPTHALRVKVYLDKFPLSLDLSLKELGSLLIEIEKEYKGKLKIYPLNSNSTRVKRDHYPVRVKPKTFSFEARQRKKPSVSQHDGFWCLSLPGQRQLLRVGRVGSFKGELFAILTENRRWGTFQSVEYVLDELSSRVNNIRTAGNHSPEKIREHLKEINETLYDECKKRVVRIGDWPNMIGIIWEHALWNAALSIRKGVPVVGFVKAKIPTRIKKNLS